MKQSCQVTGRRSQSVDLPQGGFKVPCTFTLVGQSQDIMKIRKLIGLAPAKSTGSPPCKIGKLRQLLKMSRPVKVIQNPSGSSSMVELDRKAIASKDLLND